MTGTQQLDRIENIARTERMPVLPDHHPLTAELNILMKQIDAGTYVHPMEIWELAQALREEGAETWADILAEHLPK